MELVGARNARKEDNRGRMQPITKVTMKMHHPVREDLLRYLQSNIDVYKRQDGSSTENSIDLNNRKDREKSGIQ